MLAILYFIIEFY